MKYKCTLCYKEFKQKSHFDVHINRKYSCDIKNNNHKILKTQLKVSFS